MCCTMNGVSHDLKLAVAVSAAGAMPSLIPNNLEKDITFFKKITKTTDVVVSVNESKILDLDFVNQLIQFEIKFIELMRDDYVELLHNNLNSSSKFWSNNLFLKNLSRLKDNNVKIIYRMVKYPPDTYDIIDAICIKGKESAGWTNDLSVAEQIEKQKSKTPHIHLISYGGVSGPNDVKKYLELGVSAVGVGTLFAATWESCLDKTVKESMVKKSKKDIIKFADTNQNSLIIGAESSRRDDDWNRTKSLYSGIQGKVGHIYAGHSIDGVTKIRTVKETVEFLVSKIK